MRWPTTVPGLDEVLSGGLFPGALYLVTGEPGTGKTVFANQLAFGRAAAGEQCLYVTLLTESHARMTQNLQGFDFFDSDVIGTRLHYVSGTHHLRDRGLEGLYALVEEEVGRRNPTLLIIDGMGLGPRAMGASEADLMAFMNRLGPLMEVCGCTALLSLLVGRHAASPEQTLADGLLELSYGFAGIRAVRELRVRKLRGSATLEGTHAFEIGPQGIVIYPRLEATARTAAEVEPSGPKLPVGIDRLDAMLEGGLPAASTTAVAGAPGTGKTLLGLQFLAEGCRTGERAMCFGFCEGPAQLVSQGERIGLPIGALRRDGRLHIVWEDPVENIVDRMGRRLLEGVSRQRPTRLFVDGLEAFSRASVYRERMGFFLNALLDRLRSMGVTVLLSSESSILGTTLAEPGTVSALVDNAILLRYVELRSHLYRLLSIVKVRGSSFESSLREFRITDRGFEVAETFESAEAILTGVARAPAWCGGDQGR